MHEIEGSVTSFNDKEVDHSLGKKSSSHSIFSFSLPKFSNKLRLKSTPKNQPHSNLYVLEESKGDYGTIRLNRREELLDISKNLDDLQSQFLLINEQEINLAELIAKYIKDKSIKFLLEEQLYKYEKSVGLFKKKSTVLMNKLLRQKLERKKKEKKQLIKEVKYLRKHFKAGVLRLTGNGSTEISELMRNSDHLEEKIDKLKNKKEKLQDSCKTINRENTHLKAELRKLRISNSLDQALKDEELTRCKKTLEDCLKIGNNILAGIRAPSFKAHDLYELMTLIRENVQEVENKLSESEEQTSLMKMELESLRDANMRLQENLQKSTTELDNLSRKLDGATCYEKEKNFLQLKCERLEKDIDSLKDKLRNTTRACAEHYNCDNLNQEIYKKNASTSEENIHLRAKVEALNTIISKYESGGLCNKSENREKYENLQAQITELTAQNKYLTDKVEQMREDSNKNIDQQHAYYQQVILLQEEMDMAIKENDLLKQKLEAEHETLIFLKNERVKYLEEKNVIKVIFQQLKTEIERLQKLEGTMADMSMEASRLAVIAEYNKELGEQLKNEVESKDRTIWELTSKSDIRTRTTTDLKMIPSIPTKLASKNNSVRKFLKHFAHVAKERDALLQNQEKYRHKFEELKRRVDRENRMGTEPLNHVKELQIQDLLKEVDKLNKIIKEYESKEAKNQNEINKERSHESIICDQKGQEKESPNNSVKEPEKKLSESEKEKMEDTISYLKKTVQRLQHELDEAREQEMEYKDLYTRERNEKSQLIARLDEEEIQVHNYEKTIRRSEEEIREKENEIQQLSRVASELQEKATECESLRSSLESVKSEKMDLDKKYSELQQKFKDTEVELVTARSEINRLESHFKTALRQMEEKKREYQTKFDKISNQFVGLLQNLDKEKLLYQELAQEYTIVKRDLVEKDSACGHLSMNVQQAKDFIRMLQEEKTNMSEELQSLIDDYNILLEEKKEVENALSEYQVKYKDALHNYDIMEENMNTMIVELKEARKSIDEKNQEVSSSKKKMQDLNEELCQAHLTIISLKDNLFSLEERITSLEFQKCELTLQLREANGKLEIQSMVHNSLNLPPT